MLQRTTSIPTDCAYPCKICGHRIRGYHEHDPLYEPQTIDRDTIEVAIHFEGHSDAREWWPNFRWSAIDWDHISTRLNRAIGYPPSIEDGSTILVETREMGMWWRARRRRMTLHHVIRFEEFIRGGWCYTYHIYVSIPGDVGYEADYQYHETMEEME